MKRILLAAMLTCAGAVVGQEATKTAPDAKGPLSGRWTVTADVYGTPLYFKLNLEQHGDKLTGDLNGDKLEGKVNGSEIQFASKDEHGGTGDAKATVKDAVMSGTFIFTDGDDPTHRETHSFTATLVLERKKRAPQRHEF